MAGNTEINFGEQEIYQHKFKINNCRRFVNTQTEFRSKYIEVFPSKKVAFVIKPLPEASVSGESFTSYLCPEEDGWTTLEETDKFFSLELLAAAGLEQLRLAVIVEIVTGDSSQTVRFGDPQQEKYMKFDERVLKIKPLGHLLGSMVRVL